MKSSNPYKHLTRLFIHLVLAPEGLDHPYYDIDSYIFTYSLRITLIHTFSQRAVHAHALAFHVMVLAEVCPSYVRSSFLATWARPDTLGCGTSSLGKEGVPPSTSHGPSG